MMLQEHSSAYLRSSPLLLPLKPLHLQQQPLHRLPSVLLRPEQLGPEVAALILCNVYRSAPTWYCHSWSQEDNLRQLKLSTIQ